jgi:hypothetical protein
MMVFRSSRPSKIELLENLLITMNIKLTRTALFLAPLLGGVLSAQTVTPIGGGIPQGISPDGQTIVGLAGPGGAWRWTADGGQVGLPGSSAAYGVSADGATVFGDANDNGAGSVWTDGTGWVSIGGIAGAVSGCPSFGSPYNFSDTGSVGVGLGYNGCNFFAYKWTPGTGITDLGTVGVNGARANDVSGDGTHVGGWDQATNGSRRAAIWFPNGTEQLILENPATNPIGSGEVWGFSTDGTWASGVDSPSGQAFRWSAGTGVELIGSIPGFNGATGMAIADDGKTVVGFTGTAFFGITGWIWTEADGIQRFSEFAAANGINIPEGQDFQILSDLTPDGRYAIGYIAVDAGPFSPKTPVLIDLRPEFTIDTEGLSLSAGGMQNFSIAFPGRPNEAYWIFGSGTGTSPGLPLGGGLVLPLNFDGYFQLTLFKPNLGIFSNFIGTLDGSGEASAAFNLPSGSDPSLAGITLSHAVTVAPTLGSIEAVSAPVQLLLLP